MGGNDTSWNRSNKWRILFVLLLIRPTVKLGTNLWSASILVWIRSVWSHACSSTLSPSEEMNTWRTSSSCEELRCEETSHKVNEMLEIHLYSLWCSAWLLSFQKSFNTTHTEVWRVRSEFTHCQLWRITATRTGRQIHGSSFSQGLCCLVGVDVLPPQRR